MFANHVPVLAMLVPSFALVLLTDLLGSHSGRFKRRCFLARHLLRSPGESVRIQLEHMSRRIAAYVAAALTIPLLVYSACLSLRNAHAPMEMVWAVVEADAVSICIIFLAAKLWSLLGQKHELVIELETKMAVAQELNVLAHDGYRVFHDIPAAGFSIAHVVVGETGVYAIETRGFSGPKARSSEASWEVDYSGTSLRFPGRRETNAIDQTKFHAAWLQTWLSEALGEVVPVHPVLILPGWYINQGASGCVRVGNGKNLHLHLHHDAGHRLLTSRTVQRIASQIDARSRRGMARSAIPALEQEFNRDGLDGRMPPRRVSRSAGARSARPRVYAGHT